jgi:hypothetical protein
MKAKANSFRTILVLPVVLVALAAAMTAVAIVSGSVLGPAYADETSHLPGMSGGLEDKKALDN